ncbi:MULTISPECIES: tRNA (guanosine(18)-2'-O)-methyltransferase TrmH [unclassified Colwellia]|uniref:tRNA (guanosine(18)-2'-O)-methyltransferase TrmH n=1 Tax=unclassified Colwellia TaxID=196834 RepID=UPI0015F64E39|nr:MULTISPECIES: tRNA (guanosine(18)-2'-O)-methyltransferase TrmH [unclassified Colwellia]MBA6231200.1 tRNA (guanosine(18)-2'-O)-methyltransferase TrmH [Colwellia sp. MB02u-7]MBA6235031.1 tRNA (guanosine(18)-2'-O)-methyltransferase TrmH [Colwellia sp. MB02u-11]MBA6257585.1 tRNA (guanosine(18)-2'-O)-methyltransferase TrmH [Colwellia sp. MB3u-28]MBA6260657.1 tRNA (guanosine(18)-2'-O)-methyltransferase TrmH [Colwellia sp. MB3u-41]MBA6301760.1 tRNA (guanosine(18)-2'-O)-methyltransferase TrmH [Colw
MTPERLERINKMLDKRQPDLTVCMEGVHKSHNLAAVVRTADAIGVSDVHAIWKSDEMEVRGGSAAGSQNWIDVHNYSKTSDAIDALKKQGMQVLVTNLSDNAVDFREIDYTKPTAIILGQEKFGASDIALEMADQHIVIPMVGMVQSLNVSVACSVVLYEAQRQRQLAGMYNAPRIDESRRQRFLFEGGHPIFAEACKRKGLSYPIIDEEGQIIASERWWEQMQMTQAAWKALDN